MESSVAVRAQESTGALSSLVESARNYAVQAKADSTLRAYRSDWRDFKKWCESRCLESMPAAPEAVALYLAFLADTGKRPSVLSRRLAAISKAHQAAGYDSPASMKHAVVSETLKGIRRAKGVAQQGKAPALTEDIRAMVSAAPGGLLGARDRALVLVGFAGAFRRSELVGLNVADCDFTRDGLVVTLQRSKTDQEGQGRKIGIPYGSNPETCPVRALQAWLAGAAMSEGPVFRPVNRHGQVQSERLSPGAVALIVKRLTEAAGLDPSKFAGHSLRAGLATQAAIGGASERAIMNQTGHRSVAMVRRYIRIGSLFKENAAAKVGL